MFKYLFIHFILKIFQFLNSIHKDLHSDMKDNSEEFPQTVKSMQRHMTYLRLERYLGTYEKLSSEERMSQVKDLLKFYKYALTLGKQSCFSFYIYLLVTGRCDGWISTQLSFFFFFFFFSFFFFFFFFFCNNVCIYPQNICNLTPNNKISSKPNSFRSDLIEKNCA